MFEVYTGPWEFTQAAHLLRRTIYGPTKARIKQAVAEGLEGTIEGLFAEQKRLILPFIMTLIKIH